MGIDFRVQSRKNPIRSLHVVRRLGRTIIALTFLLAALLPAVAWSDASTCSQSCGMLDQNTDNRVTIVNNCSRDAFLYFNAGGTISPPTAETPSTNCDNAACHWGNWICHDGSIDGQNGCDCTTASPPCTWNPLFGTLVSSEPPTYQLVVATGTSQTIPMPRAGAASGQWTFSYGCADDKGTEPCIISAGQTIHTKSEFTAGCQYSNTSQCVMNPGAALNTALGPGDSYDISTVDGYDLPMSLSTVNTSTCSFSGAKDGSMLDLASCPKEYGYNANQPQTFSIMSQEVSHYQSTYDTLSSNPDGISMATMNSVGGIQYYAGCSGPCQWYTTTNYGTPPNPVALSSGRWNPTTSTIDTNSPGTSDFYCCANNCGVSPCTDNVSGCQCTCPGCRGTQCSKGLLGTSKKYAIQYTNFVKQIKSLGWLGYTWQYDDVQGLVGCGWTAPIDPSELPQVTFTLCPNGGDPVDTSATWTYCAASSKCIPTTSTCGGATQGSYGSLFACQSTDPTAKNKYYIRQDTALGNPPTIPDSTFSYCVWDATKGSLSYEDCVAQTTPAGSSIVPANSLLLGEEGSSSLAKESSWVITRD